jgi:hypothetical protein
MTPCPTRFVLRRRDGVRSEKSTVDAIAKIQSAHGRLVDSAPGMLLFEGTPPMAARLAKQLPDWQMARETLIRPAPQA